VELKKMARDAVDTSLEPSKNEIEKRETNTFNQKEKLNKIASFVGIEGDEELVENIAVAMDDIAGKYYRSKGKKDEVIKNASSSSEKQEKEKKEKKDNNDSLENIERFTELKKNVKDLKDDLEGDNYDEMDIEVLFERLDKRIEDVKDGIESETPKNINGIINSTKALTNNAKHFIKKGNGGDSSQGNSGKGRGK
jgi:Rad3-related DNA helicase